MIDLDNMEHRARPYALPDEHDYVDPEIQDIASDVLALVARVRELETSVAAQKAIISTGMSAFAYGRGEGIAAERKRCAEVAREHAQIALGHADLDAHEIAESIAEAIKRGAEDGGRKA